MSAMTNIFEILLDGLIIAALTPFETETNFELPELASISLYLPFLSLIYW